MSTLRCCAICLGLLVLAGAAPPPRLTPAQRQKLLQRAAARGEDADQADEAGEHERALPLRRSVLTLLTRLYGGADRRVTDARLALARTELVAGLDAAQRRQVREANRLERRGVTLFRQNRSAEAVPLLRQGLAIRQRVFGEDHPDTAGAYFNLGVALGGLKRDAEGERLLRRALAIHLATRGEAHPTTSLGCHALATFLR
jgi:hypothetical protein